MLPARFDSMNSTSVPLAERPRLNPTCRGLYHRINMSTDPHFSIVDGREECDDGNMVTGDGCSPLQVSHFAVKSTS